MKRKAESMYEDKQFHLQNKAELIIIHHLRFKAGTEAWQRHVCQELGLHILCANECTPVVQMLDSDTQHHFIKYVHKRG